MKNLKLLSLLEGTSLILLLLIAVPVKRMLDFPELVQIIGPIHGVLFIIFNLLLLNAFRVKQITFLHTIIGFIASLIPFGSFVFKAKILNKLPN